MRALNLPRLDKLALLGIVLAVGAAPVVAAERAATRHQVIDARAMKAAKVDFATTYAIHADGGLRNVATVYACFNTGLHLPHGVEITRVTVAYAGGVSAADPVAAVIRNPLVSVGDDSEAVTIKALPRDTGGRKILNLPLTGPTVIDNTRFAYGVGVCLSGAEADIFYAIRITYTAKPPIG